MKTMASKHTVPQPLRRPQVPPGSYVTTPGSAKMMQLLGSAFRHGGVTFSRDEARHLARMYGYEQEKPRAKPAKPERKPDPPNVAYYERERADRDHQQAVAEWERWQDPRTFFQAGADLNMIREAENDGLRLVAWLAKFITPGEDPLKTVVQLVVDAGWDVDPEDIAWADPDGVVEDEEQEAPPKVTKTRKRA